MKKIAVILLVVCTIIAVSAFDGDGSLTLSDTVILARAVAGWAEYAEYLPAA